MPDRLTRLAAYAGRPLLIRGTEAAALARRIAVLDPRLGERRSGFGAFLRRVGLAGRPQAFDLYDEDDGAPTGPARPAAYRPLWLGEPDDAGEWGWTLKDGIALLSIDSALAEHGWDFCGWVHGYDTILAALDEIDADARVGGVFVAMDSPGGVVCSGLPRVAERLRTFAKPVHVHAEMAASAAYWLACGASRFTAGNYGLIGSIGAVYVHIDESGALAKDGIVVEPIQFGAKKTDGAPYQPLSEGGRADLAADIGEIGQDFVEAVVRGRPNLTAEAVLATEAAAYFAVHRDPARSALALGLIDAVEDEITAFTTLAAMVAGAKQEPIMPKPTIATILADKKLADAEKVKRIAAFTGSPKGNAFGATVVVIDDEEGDEEDGEEVDPEAVEEAPPANPPKKKGPPVDPNAESEDGKVDAATAQAVLALPEAKGREKLAQRLAFKPGMTLAEAQATLADAPRGTRLADAMRDPDVAANGGGTGTPGLGAHLMADAKARAEQANR